MTSNIKATWWSAFEETLKEVALRRHFSIEAFNEANKDGLAKIKGPAQQMGFEDSCRQMGITPDIARANFARDIERMIPVMN